METVISILSRFVADAVWCCAAVAAFSLGCAVVWKWQDLAEGLKGEPKTFRAVFVAMLVAAATLFSKVDPNGAPPNLNAPLSGPVPTLQVGSPDEPAADVAKFAAINWTTNGVDLVLHRPESLATEAVEVTLAGSTNLVTATWEPFTNVVFAAGETNVAVRVDSAQLDAHSVSNMCFFAFINAGDADEDGLADWHERFNLKIDPDDPDSDGDGMPDGWEWENGLNPGDPQDAWLDSDEDGLANLEEYGIGTDPREGDTDNDGLDDREEFGWIEPRGVFPDLSPDESTVYICSSPQGHVSQGVYPFSLPFPVRLCGRVCTRGFADVHGVVRFLPADGPAALAPLGDNGPLPSAALADGVSVAAYWDSSLGLRGSGVSSIRLTDKTVGGRRYAVVEYNSADIGDFDLLTFRVAVCADAPDEAVVQYVSLDDPHEGRTATFGAQGPGGWPRLQLSCNAATPVCAGLSFVYHLGTGTDPCDADTDGDGMPDGWELGGGLLPNSAEGADGAAGDPDEDGLSNWMEYALGTLPFDRYSFDDAVDDLEWIDWGYGMPLSDYATVQVSVGDPSGSHSERWKLVLEDAAPDGRRHVVACSESGEVASRTLRLERGRTFVGRLEHLGSSQEQPDYDWTARVCGWPMTPVLPQGGVQTSDGISFEDLAQGVVVYNLDGLLGICDDSFSAYDNTVGKTFVVRTAKTQVEPARTCVPCGFSFRTSFSLSADSDSLADWTIEPVTPGGPRLYASPAGGEGATSLQGVSRVYVSAGADAALYTVTARHPRFENLHSSAEFAVCRFQVEGVRFNTNEYDSSRDALNIRSNHEEKGFDYETGEWADGGRVNFPVCYKGGVLPRIQVRLSMTPAITVSARFCALQTVAGSPLHGFTDSEVHFADGVSGWATLAYGGQPIETKVRRSVASFDWYLCGIDGQGFVPSPIGTTGPHRVYTILADPVEPWSTVPVSDRPDIEKCMAWTNALEWACTQAEGETTQDGVAAMITTAINISARFRYDVVDGASHYVVFVENGASRVLDLTEAIHRLNGDFALGGEVNCTDCAALVVSFSNLLGCGLYSSIMGVNFATRKYCAIGRGLWLPPDWGWSFSYHEVAWSGTASDSDLVYDACLRYNGNSDPAIEPGTPELPIGIVFSDGDAGMPFVYRERLTPPSLSGYESCLSIPGSKKRAPIR